MHSAINICVSCAFSRKEGDDVDNRMFVTWGFYSLEASLSRELEASRDFALLYWA